MNGFTDQQLLREYSEKGSDGAFAELVRRHVDFVYSAALRMTRDSHLAQDATQAVFIALSKEAGRLAEHPVLSGWLHRTAHNTAINMVRTNVRRAAREQEAAAMNELEEIESAATWKDVAPVLDAALEDLAEEDRDALLLRYFERKSAKEMAEMLGVSDVAAQKRVTRAVDRLRNFLEKRGVGVSPSALALVISAKAVEAAPAALSMTICAGVGITTLNLTAQTTMHWLNLKFVCSLVAAGIAAGAAVYCVQHGESVRLRSENTRLFEQQEQLKADREAAVAAAAQAKETVVLSEAEKAELLRLRGQMGVLLRHVGDAEKLGSVKRTQANAIPIQTAVSTGVQEYAVVSSNTVNALKLILLYVRMYSMKHEHVYPTNFEQIVDPELATRFHDPVTLETFEFVSHAAPINDYRNPDKIVARERTARRTPDGKWIRAYGMADGSVIERLSNDGNYEGWENEHRLLTR